RSSSPRPLPSTSPAYVSSSRARPSRSSDLLESARSSSRKGPCPHHSARRWALTSAVSPRASRYSKSASRGAAFSELEAIGNLVERGMAVDLVVRRVEQARGVFQLAGMDVLGPDHPDAGAFPAPRVGVARVLERLLGVRGVQAAHVPVVQSAPAADEHLP